MFAKRFFYVCAGIFLLALAYHLGARNATAQLGSTGLTGVAVSGSPGGYFFVMTPNGDVYSRPLADWNSFNSNYSATALGNFWSGATPASQQSWGSVKARYRGERQTATERR